MYALPYANDLGIINAREVAAGSLARFTTTTTATVLFTM